MAAEAPDSVVMAEVRVRLAAHLQVRVRTGSEEASPSCTSTRHRPCSRSGIRSSIDRYPDSSYRTRRAWRH